MKDATWTTNLAENRDRWFKTQKDGERHSCYALENAANTWQRQPVAIHVGAGPSLDRSLADLRRLRMTPQSTPYGNRQAILFATDGALKPLLAAGIKPHFVVMLDEHEVTERFFSGIKAGNMTLLASATAFHEALLAWEKSNPRDPNSIYFWANANPRTQLERLMFMAPLKRDAEGWFSIDPDADAGLPDFAPFPFVRGMSNSVAMMGVALAQRMGIRSHFLVGCDYGVETLPDGTVKTHCDNFAVDQTSFVQEKDYARHEYVERVTSAMKGHADRINGTRMLDRYPIYNCTDGRGALTRMVSLPLIEAARKHRFLREEPDATRNHVHGGGSQGDPGEVQGAREGLLPGELGREGVAQEVPGHHVQVGG